MRSASWILLCLGTIACATEDAPNPPSSSPDARPEIVASLRQDLATPRHVGDGGGRAWLELSDEQSAAIGASEIGDWTIVYEAGPHGIAPGGMLFLQVSPFWGWSPAQSFEPRAPGFTTVETDAEGVELSPSGFDQGLFAIRVGGRGLADGERVRIHYGAGSIGSVADRYAESESRFWIAVDADGDGIRGLIADSPSTAVLSGPPRIMIATLPSTAVPGDTVRLTIALLDGVGNAGHPVAATIELRPSPEGIIDLPESIRLQPDDAGRATVDLVARAPGTVRIEATADGGWSATSNPLTVGRRLPRLLWADLHGHSGLSDGTGTPYDYFVYAREVAALDAVSLTDHDHWGMQALVTHPEVWDEIVDQTEAFHQPGRFVTILGYEWTSWLHGHRHVLYFEDRGDVLSSVDPAYETPQQLWEALADRRALTFAHHSAGGPIATNWSFPPDPVLEPMTEIVSVHGSSEASDSPGAIYSPRGGNYVRDVLDQGFELGFIGSGDSHDGHPGLSQLASGSGGLAAIYSEDLTREAILRALRARRAYATNGERILLHAELDGRSMGAEVEPGEARLTVRIAATGKILSLDLIRSAAVIEIPIEDDRNELDLALSLAELESGEYLYLRLLQENGGVAWSSPWFVR